MLKSQNPDEVAYRQRVGKRVKVRRVYLDLSQEQVAAAAGVTRNFVSAIERGAQGLDAFRMLKIAQVLGLAPQYLLSPEPLDLIAGQ